MFDQVIRITAQEAASLDRILDARQLLGLSSPVCPCRDSALDGRSLQDMVRVGECKLSVD